MLARRVRDKPWLLTHVAELGRPHQETEDTQPSLEELAKYLS